jgi:hypothetical protein
MANIGGLLAGRPYSAPAVRRCSKGGAVPGWEWRCTRDRCRLAAPKPEIIIAKYSNSDRRRCEMHKRVWEAE